MRIVHISDTHGSLPNGVLPKCDLVVHSGDFFPNRKRKDRVEGENFILKEMEFQRDWLDYHAPIWLRWLRNVPMVISDGNHDFLPLNNGTYAGFEGRLDGQVFNITNQTKTFKGLVFHGFPYIPRLDGEWNHEADRINLGELTKAIPPCDVLVAHCPPAGLFDTDPSCPGKGFGNTALTTALSYGQIEVRKAVLSGHFHGAAGIDTMGIQGVMVSQAAEAMHVIDL